MLEGVGVTPLIVAALVLPLAGAAIACAAPRVSAWAGLVTTGAVFVVVVMLCAAVLDTGEIRYALGAWGAPLGIALSVDGLSAFMLLTTAAVAVVVAAYARSYFRPD